MQTSSVKRSLLTEMTTFGVDDWLFVVNVELFLVIGAGLRIYSWAAIALSLHFVLMLVTKFQPRVLEVYLRHIRQSSRYTNWSGRSLQRGKRPEALLAQISLRGGNLT